MNDNNALEGTKILSLTDGNGNHHSFISEAEEETYGHKLRYYMWLSRLFVFFTILSLGVFTASSLTLFKMAPQVTIEPFLIISQDNSDHMVRYEPIERNMASQKQLMESFIKQYIILRNTIIQDEAEMRSRWYPGGMVHFMSSYNVFKAFDDGREKRWRQMFKDGMVREVEIVSVGKLGGEKSPVWKIDFKTYDLAESARDSNTKGLVLKTRYWTASLTSYFIPERRFISKRLINPLGFTVVRFSQTEVEIYQ